MRTIQFILAVAGLTGAMPVAAAILIDTGPTPQQWGGGNAFFRMGSGMSASYAARFALSEAARIEAVEAFMMPQSGSTFTVAVARDSSGFIGEELLAAQASATQSQWGWNGARTLSLTLDPGAYWAVFQVRSTDDLSAIINGDVPRPVSAYAYRSVFMGMDSGWTNSNLQFGLRVSGEDIPTPLPSVVPEPGTWTLMIAGFAFVGASLRRQSRLQAA